ncbi:hypothetical protein PR202_ga17033 [Eleusine coracana subsp. coracana]|uniref:C2H2-type domain-containing protein n=1 Tax=Eleusine coracana subsp. coracana TaxID=191504 RepID=A0AAV5CPG0_ELECO|nr:hypothetical protein QOZ80_6AG0519310 [Eleusine coracana subsp. coracana]GJM99894.1 hypothetical protein PR202_ga17033 [Eleusine coracana subsp. coracana]
MSPIRGTSTKPAPGHASGGSSAGKPKRTCFPCVACGRTFPTQQAMAGHSSTHSRASARSSGEPLPDGTVVVNPHHGPGVAVAGGHHGLRGVHVPAAVVPRPSHFLPFVHRNSRMMSNQQLPRVMPRIRLLGGASTRPSMADVTVLHAATSFRAADHHVLGTPVRWGPVFPYYTLLPPLLPRYMASSVPVLSRASSVDQQVPLDLTLQLGSGAGGGGSGAQRRVCQSLDGDGGGAKTGVAMDDGDRGGQMGKDLDGFDLELHLGR